MSRRLSLPPSLIAITLLLIYAYLQLSSLAVTSITIDEPSHLVAGYAFLTRGDTRIQLNGPMLPNLIGALPLLLQPDLKLTPADDPMWDANDHNGISDEFVWRNTVSPFRLIFLARFPFMAIGWLLGALIFRWAKERAGAWAGVFALTLFVFDPNLLAHSRFVMTDFAPTACAVFALYALDRSLRQPSSRKWIIVAGAGLGLALASKFSLIMLIVAASLLLVLNEFTTETQRHREFSKITLRLRAFAVRFFILLAVAAVTVWAVYAFQFGSVRPGGVPVPAPGFRREWQSAQFYLTQPWPNYLFGQTSTTGWWYYFPIALLVKTPLPMLILFAFAFARTFIKRTWRADAIFLLPLALIFISLLFSTNNLGYRYLFPLLPLSFVYISRSISPSLRPSVTSKMPRASGGASPRHLVTLSLVFWLVVGTLAIAPYYLTYFNEIAGGPDRGRYILSDSNIDWGQDLIGLMTYLDRNNLSSIKLSYFGISHPTAYGLTTEALLPVRTAMNDQGAWWLKTYYPRDPAPGAYAISVANLMGGIWIDRAEYAFFRDRPPATTIGNSIYLYTIAPRGETANLSLAGLQIDQIDTDTYRQFNTNDVRPRWFEAASSLIAAPGESWIAIADDRAISPEFQGFFAGVAPIVRAKLTDEDRTYVLYHFDLRQRLIDAARQTRSMTDTVTFGETASLIGYRLNRAGADLTLITYWRAGAHIITPLQMFVHVVGPDGAIVAQADRLDAPPSGWRAGDIIVQVHRLALSESITSASIAIGLYNPESGVRLPVANADQFFLTPIDFK
jgi:hypothetical protein